MESTAFIREIFSGIQGEGPYVGFRQLFLRFWGCNLACSFCDTPAGSAPPRTAEVEGVPGARSFRQMKNPFTSRALADTLAKLRPPLHHSLSLTGGEPLLCAHFLRELLPAARGLGWRIFLETNGTLKDELLMVAHLVDIISMDVKLRSATDQETPWEAHGAFLKAAADKELYVKVVVSRDSTLDEVAKVARMLSRFPAPRPLVIQPVTPTGKKYPPGEGILMQMQETALEYVQNVRVIPQMHKSAGWR